MHNRRSDQQSGAVAANCDRNRAVHQKESPDLAVWAPELELLVALLPVHALVVGIVPVVFLAGLVEIKVVELVTHCVLLSAPVGLAVSPLHV